MNNEERAKVMRISMNLQDIAKEISDRLEAAAGERIAFVLVTSMNGAAQYISNADRTDGMGLLGHVLTAWKKGRADIPAHYNPDL